MTSVVDVVDPPTEYVASPCDSEARYVCAKEIPGIFCSEQVIRSSGFARILVYHMGNNVYQG
jgi:hypothetical protein